MKLPVLRAKFQDLTPCEQMPFNQHHEYRTVIPLKDCINDEFFLSVPGNLRTGDMVNMCRFSDHNWSRLIETAVVRVVECTSKHIEVCAIGNIVTIPPREEKSEIEFEDASSGVKYAAGDWTAEWGGPSYKWVVKNAQGAVMLKGIEEKEEAVGMARGDIPLNTEKAA